MTEKLPKPKRGQCGTCDWFEVWAGTPDPGTPLQGTCVVNPPMPVQATMQLKQSVLVDPTKGVQPQFMNMVQGMAPPTHELRKCAQWRPAGASPPFDDFIRPGFGAKLEEKDATKQ